MATTKIIKFTNPPDFLFDTNKASMDAAGTVLIPRVLPSGSELYMATGRLTQAADLGAYLPVFLFGDATWDNVKGYNLSNATATDYVSLNDDSGRDGVTPLTPTSHFAMGAKGAIKLRINPDYSGTPPADRYIFATGNSVLSAGRGALLTMFHDNPSGRFNIEVGNEAGTATTTVPFGTTFSAVNGTPFDFELNFDTTAGTAQLFINGISLGVVGIRTGGITRDYFYLGRQGFGVPVPTSDYWFQDIQLYNSVQHTANFSAELPRIANIYPLEALIVPSEDSFAEGFESSTQDIDIVVDSGANYVMRIVNSFYWIDGLNALVLSSGKLEESNTLAEWSTPVNAATVTAFIAAGSKITMLPIVHSGTFGLYTPTLRSNSLNYDFFKILDICAQSTLYGFVKDNCSNIASGTVRVSAKKPFFTQGILDSFNDPTDIRPGDGFFNIDLIIPNLISAAFGNDPAVPADTKDEYILEANWVELDGRTDKLKTKIRILDQPFIRLIDAIKATED